MIITLQSRLASCFVSHPPCPRTIHWQRRLSTTPAGRQDPKHLNSATLGPPDGRIVFRSRIGPTETNGQTSVFFEISIREKPTRFSPVLCRVQVFFLVARASSHLCQPGPLIRLIGCRVPGSNLNPNR